MDVYESRVVAFIDILGFKEALKNKSKAVKIYDALTGIKNQVELHFASDSYKRFQGVLDTEITAFSDSVVISGSADQAIIVYLQVLRFSELLIKSGFLCRGAISLGDLHHKNGVLFGQAFVDAFNDESKRAIYPRVIVNPEVKQLILESENQPGEFEHLLRTDFDGELFIDLTIINDFSNQTSLVENDLSSIIKLEPETQNRSIKQKHEWLIRTYGL